MQIVFQNPDSALNRRHRVSRLLLRSLKKLLGLTGARAERRAHELIDDVRLPQRSLAARPTQLSGGQKQRVAIARAFSGEPRLVVCDEPTSALDVSVQAAILNLLVDLQAEHRTSYVFISHDLGVVRYLSDRIAVLYLGRLMELGTAEEVFDAPHHPYTEALLSAVPSTDPGTHAHQALRRHPLGRGPSLGLRLPDALPAQARRDLRGRRAAARGRRRRAADGVPHPARGASTHPAGPAGNRFVKRPLPAEAFTREETYAATRLPVELATTLIPDAYTEQSYFDLEREQVFARSWIPVCVADEVRRAGGLPRRRGRRPLRDRVPQSRRAAACASQRVPASRGPAVRCGPGPRPALLQMPVPLLGLRPRRKLPRDAALHRRLRGATTISGRSSTPVAPRRSTRPTTASTRCAANSGDS